MAAFFRIISQLLLLLFILFGMSSCQQQSVPNPSISNGLENYIVLTDKPPADEDITHFSLRILSKVVGGDKVASFALIYTYSYAATGFAAQLSLDQVSALEKMPEVLAVIKSRSIHLDSPRD